MKIIRMKVDLPYEKRLDASMMHELVRMAESDIIFADNRQPDAMPFKVV